MRDNLYTIILKPEFEHLDLKYFLGLINSKFLTWFYQNIINPEKGEALAQVKRGHIIKLPLVYPDLSKKNEQKSYEKMVNFVSQMLFFKNKLTTEKIPSGKTIIEQQITAINKQIDNLVYELYGLNQEEIAIIEQN